MRWQVGRNRNDGFQFHAQPQPPSSRLMPVSGAAVVAEQRVQRGFGSEIRQLVAVEPAVAVEPPAVVAVVPSPSNQLWPSYQPCPSIQTGPPLQPTSRCRSGRRRRTRSRLRCCGSGILRRGREDRQRLVRIRLPRAGLLVRRTVNGSHQFVESNVPVGALWAFWCERSQPHASDATSSCWAGARRRPCRPSWARQSGESCTCRRSDRSARRASSVDSTA